MNRVSVAVAPPSWSTSSRSTTSELFSNLDRSWPPSPSLNLCDHGLQVYLWVTRSWPPSAFPSSLDRSLQGSICVQLDLGLQVHLHTRSFTAFKGVSEFNLILLSKCITQLLDLSLRMHLHTVSTTAFKWISELARSGPPRASLDSSRSSPPNVSPNLLYHGFQVHLWVTESWPPSASSKSLTSALPVHLWFTQSRPPSASPNWLDHRLQVHLLGQLDLGLPVNLPTCLITASMCISMFSQLPSPGAPGIMLQYHLHPDWE